MKKALKIAGLVSFSVSVGAHDLPNACEKDYSRHSSKVMQEKVLCLNSGSCTQEVYFMHDGFRRTLSNSEKPWVRKDESIEVLRIVTRTAHLRRYGAGSGQTYYYKLARYCTEEP